MYRCNECGKVFEEPVFQTGGYRCPKCGCNAYTEIWDIKLTDSELNALKVLLFHHFKTLIKYKKCTKEELLEKLKGL